MEIIQGPRGGKNFLVEIQMYKKLFHHLMYPQFRGLWVFGNIASLKNWSHRFGPYLHKLGGKYTISNTVWDFPWGAQLKLQVVSKPDDYMKLRGIELSDVEYDASVSLSKTDLGLILSRIRIPLPDIKDTRLGNKK